jgi:hypothetical protein
VQRTCQGWPKAITKRRDTLLRRVKAPAVCTASSHARCGIVRQPARNNPGKLPKGQLDKSQQV